MAPVYRKMEFLYEKLIEDLDQIKATPFIDFHESFASYDETNEMFIDFMHTTPLGEEKITDKYFKVVNETLSRIGKV